MTFVFVVPFTLALVLAGTVGGATAVAVVLVFWASISVFVLVGGRFVFRSFVPLRNLVETTDRLADGDYSARADVDASPPLQPIVRSLNTMADRLETSDLHRRRLLADVGHELRTPLTIIRGSLEAMTDGVREFNPSQLTALLGDVEVMERLLDDLRTLSAADAGKLELHKELTDIADLVETAVHAFAQAATAGGVDLIVVAPSEPLDPVEADPVRIREVLHNLIANALRATSEGGSITVEHSRAAAENTVTITVTDDGIGMAADEVLHAFDRFQKGPNSTGSGLGLAISRDLIDAHGGRIDISSAVAVGTTVIVQLPIGV